MEKKFSKTVKNPSTARSAMVYLIIRQEKERSEWNTPNVKILPTASE